MVRDRYPHRMPNNALVRARDLARLIPAFRHREGSPLSVLRITIPNTVSTFDVRLLSAFREASIRSRRLHPLIVQIGAGEEGVSEFNPELADEVSLAVERGWQGEWYDVPLEKRPGLVLSRRDGVVVLDRGVDRRLGPALAALCCFSVLSAETLRWALASQGLSIPPVEQLSAALRLLHGQGLVTPVGLASSDGKTRRGVVGRPRALFSSLPMRAFGSQQAAREPLRDTASYPGPDVLLREWLELCQRLRLRGLRTV
jgi:hypothetical protein